MPNKPNPNHEQMGARVPRDVVNEFREVAAQEGMRTGELLEVLMRAGLRRLREERRRRGVRRLGRQVAELADLTSSMRGARPHRRKSAG